MNNKSCKNRPISSNEPMSQVVADLHNSNHFDDSKSNCRADVLRSVTDMFLKYYDNDNSSIRHRSMFGVDNVEEELSQGNEVHSLYL